MTFFLLLVSLSQGIKYLDLHSSMFTKIEASVVDQLSPLAVLGPQDANVRILDVN